MREDLTSIACKAEQVLEILDIIGMEADEYLHPENNHALFYAALSLQRELMKMLERGENHE